MAAYAFTFSSEIGRAVEMVTESLNREKATLIDDKEALPAAGVAIKSLLESLEWVKRALESDDLPEAVKNELDEMFLRE